MTNTSFIDDLRDIPGFNEFVSHGDSQSVITKTVQRDEPWGK